MKNKKKIIITTIVSFFFISLIGTLLHFTYELSLNNVVVGTFSAVNESIWEHLKILVMPMFVAAIYEYIILKDSRDNFFVAMLLRMITGMLIIIIVYYTYTSILGKSIDIVNIVLFYISVLISQYIWYKTILKEIISKKLNIVSLIISYFILLLFIIFTFYPPKLGLFKDNRSGTYGIFENI